MTTLRPGWMRRLAPFFLIRSGRDGWTPAIVWSVIAMTSVLIAVTMAMQPGQLQDLHTVRSWMSYWLSTGENPYTHFRFPLGDPRAGTTLDYPPMAFLLLWPLGLASAESVAWWYLPAAVVVTVLAVWALVRWMADTLRINLSTAERIALVAIVVAGTGSRVSLWRGQTVVLSLWFGALAMRWCRSRPWVAALMLALCSFKPHIALGFGLAILLTEGVTVVALAGSIVVALSWGFAASVGHSLPGLLLDLGHNLVTLYAGVERVRGLLSIRFVLDDLIQSYQLSTGIYAALAISSLAALVILSRRRVGDAVITAQVSVACILWSVMFFPHQRYNALYLAPALWLLMWPESGLIQRTSHRVLAVSAYVLFGLLDVPLALRLLAAWHPSFRPFHEPSYFLSPVRVLILFTAVMVALRRRTTSPLAAPVRASFRA